MSESAMRVESVAIFENNETGKAIFQAFAREGRIVLMLDWGVRAQSGVVEPAVVYHPDQQALCKTELRGLDYIHNGKPIDVRNYLKLPQSRQGFFRTA